MGKSSAGCRRHEALYFLVAGFCAKQRGGGIKLSLRGEKKSEERWSVYWHRDYSTQVSPSLKSHLFAGKRKGGLPTFHKHIGENTWKILQFGAYLQNTAQFCGFSRMIKSREKMREEPKFLVRFAIQRKYMSWICLLRDVFWNKIV